MGQALYRKSENVEVKNGKAKKEIGICIASSLKTVCLNRTDPISPDSKFLKEYLYLDELIASRKKDIPFICQTAIHKGVISTSVYEYISLPYWTSDEFREWRRKIKKVTKENLAQVIAVLAQGVKEIILDGKGYPRDSQLISLLSLLKSPEGGLLQISTGEGKTLIIALFAAIQVMNGKKVGVITSSEDLATRELDKNKSKTSDFFEAFGIKVAHNINENAGEQKCYKSDVVYGDLRHFIGDYLRDISRNVMMGEGPDILVVDEVDNMFMDEIRMLVQLSWSMPGFEFLNSIFVNMWGTATSTVPNLVKKGGNWYIKYDIGKNETLTNLLDDIEFEEDGIKFTKDHEFLFNVGSDIRKFMRGFLKNYTSEQLLALNHKREHRNIVIPPQLEGYARDQVPQWVDSLLRSYQFKNKGQYLKQVNPSSTLSHNATIVAPVDYENTGTIQTDMHWGGGLHQFLQIYNGITLQAESLISIFMSYVEFFRKFKGKIYGVTGTLGGEAHREFLQKVYSPVTTIVIPTFAPKNFKEFKPIIVRDRGHWYLKMADFIMRQIKDKRPGLVIFELIEDVEKLRDYLIKIGYQDKHNQIFTLGTGGDDEDKIFKDYRLKIGDLVIATNAAGRGADFKISHEGLQNGGLHVIMTIFSKSMRVMQQALGRAARQGEAGSGQLIILVDEDEPCQDIQCLSENRDRSEIIKLKNDRLVMIPAMNIKDKLFSDYVEFMRLIAATMSYPIKLGMPKDSSGNQNILYLHQDQKDIYLTFVTRGGKKEIKITYIAERIDGNLKKRIKNILARPDATLADLSKYDYEAILFIAAEEGYLDQSDFKVSLLSDYAKIPAGNFNKNDRDRLGRYGDEQFDSKKFWQKYIYAGNTKKKFLLWLANRKQLSNEEEVDQLNENWAIWLKNQEKTINELFRLNSDELDLESLSTKRLQLKEKLYKEFEEFKKVNLLNFKKGELIVNSAYYVARADRYFLQRYFYYIDAKDPFRDPYLCDNEPWINRILDEALRCANKALELDDYYTWAARSIRSAILLHRGGKEVKKMDDEDEKYEDKIKRAYEVKKQFFDDALSVIKNIRDVRIPVEESQLGYLLSMKSLNYTDQLAIQYVATRAIFNKMIEVERNNLKLVSKAQEEEAIELNGFANIKDLADEINITQEIAETFGLNVADIPPIEFANKELVVRQIQAAGIDDIPKIKTYRLHDNRDFSGNFFGMLLGIVSIFTGTWMLGVFQGLFATAFATSMVMAGVGELLTYTYALIKGQPISFGQVLSSKGMSLAISFVTAGALSLLDQIPSIHSFLSRINLVDNLRSLGGNVGLAFAIQATTMATTGILYEFGRKIVDIDALKRDAREAINRIMEVCREMLRRIFASDFFDDTSNLIGTLYRKIDAIMTGYMERFNGEGAVFGRGVATGLASNFLGGLPLVGHLINAGTEIITNTIKNTEAIGEISEQTVKAILETSGQATKTGVVMEKLLKGDFGKERGEKLMFEMHSQQFIVASEIDHANCSRLKGLKLNEELSPYKTGVIEECNHIHRIMSRDFAEDFEAFAVRFVDQVANLKNGIQKEIVKSTASVPGGILGKYFGERIYEYIKGKVERFKAGREQEVRSGGGGDPKWQQKEWSSKESADRAQKPKASQVTITPQPHADGKGQAKSGAKSGGDIPPRQGEPKSPAGSGGGANYQVKAGDSLSTIAAKILGPRAPPQAIHQMVKQLIRLNPGVAANPDLIQIGQYLRIPEARLDGSWGFTTDSTAGSYQGEWGMDQHSSAIWEGWEKGLRFSWADALWEKLTGTASAGNLGGKPIEEPYWMRELCDYYQAGVLATGSAPGSLDPSKIPFDVDRFYEDLEDLASYEEPSSNQVYIEGMPLHEWEEQMVAEMSQAKGFYQKLKAIEGRLGGINRWVESDPELAQAVKHLNLHDQMPTAAAGSLYDVPTLGSWMLYKETGNKWYLLLMGIDIAGLGAVKSIAGGGRARLGGVLKAVARADRTATEAKSSAAQGLGRIRNEIAEKQTGWVYERIHPVTKERYIGRTIRGEQRFKEHDRNLKVQHRYVNVKKDVPTEMLRYLEQRRINEAGGIGKLANKRNEMTSTEFAEADRRFGKFFDKGGKYYGND